MSMPARAPSSRNLAVERMDANSRRDAILEAAIRVFAKGGFHGTTTDAVAREAGVSQSYVVRLFGSKLTLFLEVVELAMDRVHATFVGAIASRAFDPRAQMSWQRLRVAYAALVADRHLLMLLMHAFSASSIDEVSAVCRRCLGRIYTTLAATGATDEQVRDFLARGMLLKVMVAVGAPEHLDDETPLAPLTAFTLGQPSDPKNHEAKMSAATASPVPATRLRDDLPVGTQLTVLVVHAHPDDEASQTGGTLARYAAEGHRVVLVTCTDGRMGDTDAGIKPGSPGHEPRAVARVRMAELAQSTAALGVGEVMSLGYEDSGMPVDAAEILPTAFSQLPLAPLVSRMVDLMNLVQPDVVVTYPANGLSGHPDHIRTHEVTVAACRSYTASAQGRDPSSGGPWLYFIAISRSGLVRLHDTVRSAGYEGWLPPLELGTVDEDITTAIDVRSFREQKRQALESHTSQADARALLQLFSMPGGLGDNEYFIHVDADADDNAVRSP
ncbi:PIG-L family deacetylase [Nocardioides conyzicola]